MSKKRAIKTISLLWASSLLGAGFAFLTQIILARQFGPDGFGVFMAALMTVTMLAPLAGFGVPQLWLKVFGKEGWGATRWLDSSFRFVVFSSMLVLIVIVVWAIIGPHDQLTTKLLIVLSLYVLGHVTIELVSAKLQLEERYLSYSFWQFLPHLIRFSSIFVLFVWLTDLMTVQYVALIYGVVAIFLVVFGCLQLVYMSRKKFQLKGHGLNQNTECAQTVFPTIKTIIEQSWPFGMAGLFVFIYMQSDIILVKYITGAEAAGQYSVAFSVMAAVYLLPTVIYQKFLLPKIHRWANHDRERFFQVYRQGNMIMLVLGMIAMLAVWVLSEWGILFLYGIEYFESINLLNILALCAPLYFLATSVGATLVTQDHMKRKVKCMGLVALINIILNIVFIPSYGAAGAAVSTVISNVILLLTYYVTFRKYVFAK